MPSKPVRSTPQAAPRKAREAPPPRRARAEAPPVARVSARDRLLAAAGELFYGEGINTVGIDRVIERAGVAKASLYDCFGSKEELIRSYLAERHEARRVRIEERIARAKGPRERLLAVFDSLAETARDPKFRGCAFVRAAAEAKPGGSVAGVIEETRAWMRELLTRLGREAGAAHPDRLARQLMLLYDGVLVAAQIDRDTTAGGAARALAAQMIDAASAHT